MSSQLPNVAVRLLLLSVPYNSGQDVTPLTVQAGRPFPLKSHKSGRSRKRCILNCGVEADRRIPSNLEGLGVIVQTVVMWILPVY